METRMNMKKHKQGAWPAVMGIVLTASFIITLHSQEGPPFRPGQLVVAGPPTALPPGEQVIKYLPNANLTVIAVPPGRERGEIQRLAARGKRASLNLLAHAMGTVNDPVYATMLDGEAQWNLKRVQCEAAWEVATGLGVTVAVLDTGLRIPPAEPPTNPLRWEYYEPDGVNAIVQGFNAVDAGEPPIDRNGHGTHVAGTVAQASNNGIGCAGLAHGATIMPVKVLDDTGSGDFADIAEGIYQAVGLGADVINMSLGINARYGITSEAVMGPALDYAYDNGVTVVCAAGNDGWRKNVSYPASHVTTIAVGASDYANKITRYSNRGTGLDLVAPGGDTKDLNGDGYYDQIVQETFSRYTVEPDDWWDYFFFLVVEGSGG